MTEAMKETIFHLYTLETSNANSKQGLDNLVERLNYQGHTIEAQGKEIKALGEALTTQNSLISALQTTQVQQNQTIQQMNTVQNDLLGKINLLVRAAQGNSSTEDV